MHGIATSRVALSIYCLFLILAKADKRRTSSHSVPFEVSFGSERHLTEDNTNSHIFLRERRRRRKFDKMCFGDFCEYLFAVIFPPLAVLCATGCSCDFLISILLTLAFWIPGMCHACHVIGKAKEERIRGRCAPPPPTTVIVHSV